MFPLKTIFTYLHIANYRQVGVGWSQADEENLTETLRVQETILQGHQDENLNMNAMIQGNNGGIVPQVLNQIPFGYTLSG